ncbi:MAG: SRPBCC family protein [Nitrospirae bacterium]|nr:SRPBCC family protein [Nitrospirota bacterium]
MTTFHNTVKIHASPEKVWAVVGDLAGVTKWIPMIAHAKVEGSKRVCTMADGSGELHESISEYSHTTRSYRYTIAEGPLPVKNYRGRFGVEAKGQGALVVWDTEFEVLDPSQEAAVGEIFQGIYTQCLELPKRRIESD